MWEKKLDHSETRFIEKLQSSSFLIERQRDVLVPSTHSVKFCFNVFGFQIFEHKNQYPSLYDQVCTRDGRLARFRAPMA